MENNMSILSHNIKYLRKELKISQEELSKQLGIKRSNIAAYEIKNVEPRLRTILEIAKFFNINVKNLIESKITAGEKYPPFESDILEVNKNVKVLELKDNEEVGTFIDKSIKVRKILEGFKAFYSFKKNSFMNTAPGKEKLIFDIDNFIQLMEHLLTYNESVINVISNNRLVDKAS